MARLTTRGTNKSSLYDSTTAAAFIERSSYPHTLQWRADCYKFTESGMTLLVQSLPIVGGTLSLDSSDPIRRKLTLEIGGGASLVPASPSDPLTPFGQALVLYCRIDKADGSWFPWLKQGEYQVRSYTYERPSLIATVEAADYSAAVDEYLHLGARGYGGQSLANAVLAMCQAALPNKVFDLDRNASAKAKSTHVDNFVAEPGSGRWDRATFLSSIKGCEALFDWNGDLVVRDSIDDANDDLPPSVGPDIGTVSNPVATIKDGPQGNLVGLTATTTRDGACNYVRVNINSTVTRKVHGKRQAVDVTFAVDAEQKNGAAAWGDTFGHVPIVMSKNVKAITQEIKDGQQTRANHMLQRRRGVVRYLDLDAVGCYWLEPDDKINVKVAGVTESHYVQAVEFDLAGQRPTRVRTRALNVTDPGGYL